MQKIFTTLFLVLGIYNCANAQNNPELSVGAGYNYSVVTESGTSNSTKGKSGFNLALSAEHYFSEAWGIKIRPAFDQKGWGGGFLDFGNNNRVDNVDFTLGYITVPVMANWHFGRTRNWYLNFGPYVGFLTYATAQGYDLTDVFNSKDVGIDIGIGVKIPIGNKNKFYIEYDGQGGFKNVYNTVAGSAQADVQNSRSSFNVGITF